MQTKKNLLVERSAFSFVFFQSCVHLLLPCIRWYDEYKMMRWLRSSSGRIIVVDWQLQWWWRWWWYRFRQILLSLLLMEGAGKYRQNHYAVLHGYYYYNKKWKMIETKAYHEIIWKKHKGLKMYLGRWTTFSLSYSIFQQQLRKLNHLAICLYKGMWLLFFSS